MRVSLIAAVSANGVIGRGNELPWRLRADLKSFKAKTLGHHVIVGRKTFECFGGKPLPGRPHVIVSRDPGYTVEGCTVVSSVDAALAVAHAAGEQEAMVIGGAQIYTLALPHAQTFYRTRVLADVEGDVYFPRLDESLWSVVHSEVHQLVDEHNQYPFVLETLAREGSRESLPTRPHA